MTRSLSTENNLSKMQWFVLDLPYLPAQSCLAFLSFRSKSARLRIFLNPGHPPLLTNEFGEFDRPHARIGF